MHIIFNSFFSKRDINVYVSVQSKIRLVHSKIFLEISVLYTSELFSLSSFICEEKKQYSIIDK